MAASVSNLSSVENGIYIDSNVKLNDLDELANVSNIGNGNLVIWYNDLLSNIDGLANIDPNTILLLDIVGNSSLSKCEIESVCSYLQISPSSSYIAGNGAGCESVYEVIAACEEVSVNKIPFDQEIKIYPNPASDMVFIDLPETGQPTSLTIYDVTGQEVLFLQAVAKTQYIDVSMLKAGLYFVKLIDENQIVTGKFVKQ
jgi:hypothetical protein